VRRGHGTARDGRWSILRRQELRTAAEPRSAFAEPPDWIERLARTYLARWGVVFRDVLGREARVPPWRELLRVYHRLEARGEVRAGRFVAGPSGEQFALAEAVESLRAVRKLPREGRERVTVSAIDPLNLVGVVTAGPRVPAIPGHRVVFVDGIPEPAAAAHSA
jgi:ATP-dependent Lhr-like helicase